MASTVHSPFALIDHAIVCLNSPHCQAASDWLDEYFSLVPPFPWHHGLRRGLRHNQEHSRRRWQSHELWNHNSRSFWLPYSQYSQNLLCDSIPVLACQISKAKIKLSVAFTWLMFRRWLNSAGADKRYQYRQILTKSLKPTCVRMTKTLKLKAAQSDQTLFYWILQLESSPIGLFY